MTNRKTKPLETERLILCEIKEEDTSLIVQWRSRPEVYQYFFSPKPLTKQEHINWYYECYIKDENRIDFIATEKSINKPVGLFNIKRNISNMECGEIGYLLDKDVQRKGYAQEGVRGLMVFARDTWKCKEIIFRIHENNTKSRILADRLGYVEGEKKEGFIIYHAHLTNFIIRKGIRKEFTSEDILRQKLTGGGYNPL